MGTGGFISMYRREGGVKRAGGCTPYAYGQAYVTEDAEQTVILKPAQTAEVTLRMPGWLAGGGGWRSAPPQCNGGDACGRRSSGRWRFRRKRKRSWCSEPMRQGKCRFMRLPENSNLTLDLRDERFAKLTYTGVNIGKQAVTVGKPVKLVLAVSIAGRVIDMQGKPSAGVMVMGARAPARGLGRGEDGMPQGDYRIGRLGAGTFNVVVSPADREDQTTPPEWTVVCGGEGEVDGGRGARRDGFQGGARHVHQGEGDVERHRGAVPAMDVMVYGPADPESGRRGGVTCADGTYTLRVPAGRQHVYIGSPVPDGYVRPGQDMGSVRDVTTAQGKDAIVNFVLGRTKGKPVSGVVRRADGSPEGGAFVAAQVGGSNDDPYGGPSMRTDAEGRFLFKALTPKSRLRG